jgi:hypothetical protein
LAPYFPLRGPPTPPPPPPRRHSAADPLAAQHCVPPAADGRVPPVIPDLGSESDRGGNPDPEPALRARVATGPHAKALPAAYKGRRPLLRCLLRPKP